MLTNLGLRVVALGNTGLWLVAHCHEAGEAYPKQAADVASSPPRPTISYPSRERVTLMRIEGEVASMIRLGQMCALRLSDGAGLCIAQYAVLLFDILCKAYSEELADDEAIARMCGPSARATDKLRESSSPLIEVEDEEGQGDWLQELSNKTNDYNI